MSREIHLDVDAIRVKQEEEIPAYDEEAKPGEDDSGFRELLYHTWRRQDILHALEMEEKTIGNGTKKNRHQLETSLKDVPDILLQNEKFRQYYERKEMSFGFPVNYENSCQRELKIKLAAKFIKESGETKEYFLEKIDQNLEYLLKCCGKKAEFASWGIETSLLFLDGCSMLQFMLSCATDQLREFNISNHQAALIQQDLFLLRNQIPFRVLTLFMGFIYSDKKKLLLKRAILKFVMMNNIVASVDCSTLHFLPPRQVSEFFEKYEPVHLLDLLRTVIILGNNIFCNELYSVRIQNNLISKETRGMDDDDILFIQTGSQTRSFRNVQELKSAGIKLKPDESCNLLGISFTTRFFVAGHLKLPSLIVDNSTALKLLNLVAYEMGLNDYETNCVVSSYVNFLDLLIDCEQDVKELRAANVICNRLSSDAEVARLFNDLGSHCLPPPTDAYWNVKDKIQKHYKRRSAIWVAQVYHDHFRSPWTVLALLAAVTILFLTATQTWYSAHPR